MRKNFELKGIWFLPNKPNEYYNGTLTFNYKEGISLEIVGGLLTDDFEIFNQSQENIILGFTTDRKKITLYNCFATSFPALPSNETDPLITCKFMANYILEGAHFKDINELEFCKISISFKYLQEWLGISGFKFSDKDQPNTININYEQPQPINFTINNSLKCKFEFPVKSNEKIFEKSIKQKASLTIETTAKQLNFLGVLKNIFCFQDFLTLGAFEPIFPTSVTLQSNKVKFKYGDNEYCENINLYFISSIEENKNNQTKVSFWQMLFGYRDIKDNFENIINKWYKYNDSILFPVVNLLIETFYNLHTATENRFLNIIQAIETFHRRVRPKTVLPEAEFKNKMNLILSKISDEEKKWLSNRIYLPIANQLTLEERIREMFNEFNIETLDNLIQDKEKFIKITKNTRNYYTHYNESLKKKALTAIELLKHNEKLRVLLICAILNEAGFTLEQINNLFKRNEYSFFNHLLEDEKNYILNQENNTDGKSIDYIKENINNQDEINEYINNELIKIGFVTNVRQNSNIAIRIGKKNLCYIDFDFEYKEFGHPVARFCEFLTLNDSRIIKYIKNVSGYKRKSDWMPKKPDYEKVNIGIKCNDDFELVKKACINLKKNVQ